MPQREYLAHIDFGIYFLSQVTRANISRRFDVVTAAAERTPARYRAFISYATRFDGSYETYRAMEGFGAKFKRRSEQILSTLSMEFGDGLGGSSPGPNARVYLVLINRPALDIFASITSAIRSSQALGLSYGSLSSRARQ